MNSGQRRPKPQTEIRFRIDRKTDRNGKTYWLGWTDAPAMLDLRECSFFIFVGDRPEVCIRKREDPPQEHRGSYDSEEYEEDDDYDDDDDDDEYDDDDGNDGPKEESR